MVRVVLGEEAQTVAGRIKGPIEEGRRKTSGGSSLGWMQSEKNPDRPVREGEKGGGKEREGRGETTQER